MLDCNMVKTKSYHEKKNEKLVVWALSSIAPLDFETLLR